MEQVEARIEPQRAARRLTRPVVVAQRAVDHPGVEEEPCVRRPQAQRLGHGGLRLARAAVLVKRPGEHVIR